MKPEYHIIYEYLANPTHPISVAVIGAGGTGSHLLSGLAQISHAFEQLDRVPLHVTAYDYDTVSENNIGRQLFSPADINRNKAVVLIERINRFYGYNWDALPVRFDETSHNIVISCVDSIASRRDIFKNITTSINHSYFRQCYYWMDIGNERKHGQIILGALVDSPAYFMPSFFDEFPDPVETNIRDSCSAHMAYNKQDLFINKIMATFACDMIWELLHEYCIDYRGCYINLEKFSITKIPIVKPNSKK